MSWQTYSRIFLDTAPVVYYVEGNAAYFQRIAPIFQAFDADKLTAITSPITLAECLVMPLRQAQPQLTSDFAELIVNGVGVTCVPISSAIGERAAGLRARYNLQLLDAIQVATAMESNCDAFLTNDAFLKRVTDIRILVVSDL